MKQKLEKVREEPVKIPNVRFFGENPDWELEHHTTQAVISVIQTTNTTLNNNSYGIYKKGWYYVTCTSRRVSFWTPHTDKDPDHSIYSQYQVHHYKEEPYRSYRAPLRKGEISYSSGSDLSESDDDEDEEVTNGGSQLHGKEEDDEDAEETISSNSQTKGKAKEKEKDDEEEEKEKKENNNNEKESKACWDKQPSELSPLCLASLEGTDYDEGTIVVGEKHGLKLYNVRKGRNVTKTALEQYRVRCLARLEKVWLASGEQRRNVLACGCDGAIVVFDVDSWSVLAEIVTNTVSYLAICQVTTIPSSPSSPSSSSSYSSSARSNSSSSMMESHMLLTGSSIKRVDLWDWQTGTNLKSYLGHAGRVTGVADINHNSTFASCSEDCCIIIWDRESGQRLRCWRAGKSPMRGLAAIEEPNGGDVLLVSGSDDMMVRLWSLQGVCEDAFNAKNIVKCVSLLKSGQVACGMDQGIVKIYNTYKK